MIIATGILALLSGNAQAFCGTYIGPAGTDPTNQVSRVAYVHDGDQTTLTLANDVVGDPLEFGLLIPVPDTLTLDDVAVVDASLINAVDEYSAPRLVSYTCDDVEQGNVTHQTERWEDGEPRAASGCGGSSSGASRQQVIETTTETTTHGGGLGDQEVRGVDIEAIGEAGEYEFAILSATDGGALGRWAQDQGFEMDRETAEVLDEYVQNGSSFLAARVGLDQLPDEQTWLSPIQMTYTSPMMSLPLRLGTTASGGTQDVIVYVLGPWESGWTGISNYPEVPLESECLFDGGAEDLGPWYDDRLTDALQPDDTTLPDDPPPPTDGTGGTGDTGGIAILDTGATGTTEPVVEVDPAGWVVEFAWGEGKCDPCPPTAGDGGLDEDIARGLGWDKGVGTSFFTRLHMRFGPGQVDQDLMLYSSYVPFNSQMRYIQDEGFLRDQFPVCGEGYLPTTSQCIDFGPPDEQSASGAPVRAPTRDEVVLGLPGPTRTSTGGTGPAWPVGVGLGFGLMGLLGFLRRF